MFCGLENLQVHYANTSVTASWAIGASSKLKTLAERLSLQHGVHVHVMDLSRHGTAAMPSEKFSMPLFAEAVVELIKKICIVYQALSAFNLLL